MPRIVTPVGSTGGTNVVVEQVFVLAGAPCIRCRYPSRCWRPRRTAPIGGECVSRGGLEPVVVASAARDRRIGVVGAKKPVFAIAPSYRDAQALRGGRRVAESVT